MATRIRPMTITALIVLAALTATAQTVEQVITSFDDGHRLTRPAQLALSPTGSSIAVSDQHGNRIYIFDGDGQLIWTVGDAAPIGEPVAVSFDGEEAVIFSTKDNRQIFRTTKAEPNEIDTAADLSSVLPKDATIDQIQELGDQSYLILDRHRGAVWHVKSNWEKDKEVVSHGSRKGELWSPACLAIDLSGNIIVADEGSYPLQVFSPSGRFLFFGGWNAVQPERVWKASAVAVTRDEQIWVADLTNAQWRVFDRTGGEVNHYPFAPPVFHPSSAITTPDNRLIVADERGSVIILRLP